VEARTPRSPPRRAPAAALVRHRRRGGPVHGLGRTHQHRRTRRGFRHRPAAAPPDRRPRPLVLRREAVLAGQPDVYLSALEYRSRRLVAMAVPNRSSRRFHTRRQTPSRASRPPLLRRHALPGARLPERLSLPLLLGGRPLPILGLPGHHSSPFVGQAGSLRRAGSPLLAPNPGHPNLPPSRHVRRRRNPLPRNLARNPGKAGWRTTTWA
jgi:hypothetical protein